MPFALWVCLAVIVYFVWRVMAKRRALQRQSHRERTRLESRIHSLWLDGHHQQAAQAYAELASLPIDEAMMQLRERYGEK